MTPEQHALRDEQRRRVIVDPVQRRQQRVGRREMVAEDGEARAEPGDEESARSHPATLPGLRIGPRILSAYRGAHD